MINAILVLDKPAGLTSHDVVHRVRRITGERSVGHLGTLDPAATGVLPLLLGRFTRLAQFFNDSEKVYEGEIRFGFATDTYDAEGEPVGVLCSAQPPLGEIQRHLRALTGRIQQTPPVYSAKKIHGVPAYKLARHDKVVVMNPVSVEVHRFEIQSVSGDRARFIAEVSAGTYIRSLAHDLGQALGCGAHLTELRRTRAGEFDLSQAASLEELAEFHRRGTAEAGSPPDGTSAEPTSDNAYSDKFMQGLGNRPVEAALPPPRSPYLHPRKVLGAFPSVTASPPCIAAIRNGRSVNLPEFSDAPLVKVFAGQSLLLAVVQRIAGTLFQPRVVLFGSNEPLPL
jgi:tRNA pseudouridine55 synthase